MRLTKVILLLSVLVINIWHPAFAGSSVWKVEKNGSYIFLGGTIHLLTPADYPLPEAFDIAYQQSDKIVLEANLDEMKTPQFQANILQMLSYPKGQNLQLALREDTYQALGLYSKSRGIPIEGLLPFKPGMVSMILSITELQRLGFVGEGVDAFYQAKALADSKPMGQLETAEQQLAFISEMGQGQEDDLINSTIQEMEKLPQMMAEIVGAWRNGNLKQLETTTDSTMKDFPRIYDELVVKRNNAWIPKIEAMFNTKEIEFVLVGGLHLPGKPGLIAQLKSRGYRIEMLGE
jgi:uncharacterized protein YbaP (TraB family)